LRRFLVYNRLLNKNKKTAGQQMARLLAGLIVTVSLWGQARPSISRIVQPGNSPNSFSPGTVATLAGTGLGTAPTITIAGLNATVIASVDTLAAIYIPKTAPTGPASAVVTTSAGSSNPFSFTLAPTSPSALRCSCSAGPATSFFQHGSHAYVYYPKPGDVIDVDFLGLGPDFPSTLPKLFIDDAEVPVLGSASVAWANFAPLSGTYQSQIVVFKVPDLQPGRHQLSVQAGAAKSPPIPLDLVYSGIITSQSGFTFNAVQGGPAPAAQVFSVLSGTGTINFNVSASVVSGGNWLAATPQGGSAQAGQTGVPVRVLVDPSGLSAGTYYGSIQISANGVLNSPQTVTVVLRVAPPGTSPGPFLDSSGLVFLATQSGSNPPAQTITISNPTAATLSYSSTINAGPFTYGPSLVTIPPGQSQPLTIQAASSNLAAGIYTATLGLSFSDQSTRSIGLLLVVAPNSPPKSDIRSAGNCTPTKLLPLFSLPGAGFNVAAAWPTPIAVSVVDDCAVPLTTGTVIVTFSNGDAPLPLLSQRNGSWTGTWAAVRSANTAVRMTATATDPVTGLTGSTTTTGGVAANPDVPVISNGGVVDAASNGPALSPGSLLTAYGSKLSATAGSAIGLPWSSLLNGTTLALGGKPLPLYYTSDGQVNAMIPYDVPQNTSLQIVARSGNALSNPQPVLIVPVRPAVFVMDARGQGAIVGTNGVATAANPVKPGDVVVVYCTGLGAVNPPVEAGQPASLTTVSATISPVTAAVGGRPATVLFAGVTPGFSGLYQVNVTVPAGLPDSEMTSLVLTANGQESVPVTFAVRSPR
jgi:uncharacterized protein (TIGR03437 family)